MFTMVEMNVQALHTQSLLILLTIDIKSYNAVYIIKTTKSPTMILQVLPYLTSANWLNQK